MRARSLLPYALLAASGLALAACGYEEAGTDAPPAQVEVAEDTPPLDIPPAAPASAVADAGAGTPTEPVPYDQVKADEQKGPAQKADAENENVFY